MNAFGYAGKILRVDLSSGSTISVPTKDYADRFLGGRGIAAKIYWDEVSPDVKAFDPENRLMFVTGPLTAVPPAGSRCQICGKSPGTIPEQFCYSSLGGSWGAQLKLAGYDGIVIQGKSDKPVYLFVQDELVEIREASALWGKTSVEVRETLKRELGNQAGVVAIGPAGENMVVFANLLADNDASGSMGLGAVMGSKKLKAIAVRGSGKITVAHPQKLRELTKYIRENTGGSRRPIESLIGNREAENDVCYACISGFCNRQVLEAKDGTRGKFICGSASFYQDMALRYYGERNEVPFFANRLIDAYGLDVYPVLITCIWLGRCYRAGILTDENTGIPLSKQGSMEFIESLVKKISLREGFGDILAQGPVKAADIVGSGANELITSYMLTEYGHFTVHCPRLYSTQGLLFMTESKTAPNPMHQLDEELIHMWLEWTNKVEGAYISTDILRAIAKRFWGSELAVDFSTHEGKALAAKKMQDRNYAKESLILCTFRWPISHFSHSEDHVGDPTIESKIYSAVTGNEMDEEGLYRIGEKVFNLQRAVLAREGRSGREGDKVPEFLYTTPLRTDFHNRECLIPGKDGEVISRKGEVLDRENFAGMKDEYYALRGWDIASGLQTKEKLEELELEDLIEDLAKRRLIT